MDDLKSEFADLVRRHGKYAVEQELAEFGKPKPEMLVAAVRVVKEFRNPVPSDNGYTGIIPAIKQLREEYPGLSLKTAKDIVESVWKIADIF